VAIECSFRGSFAGRFLDTFKVQGGIVSGIALKKRLKVKSSIALDLFVRNAANHGRETFS
jgi:hypothetical protein